jgi:hypothetical protein
MGQRLSLEMSRQIRHHTVLHGPVRLERVAADMRREHHVRQGRQFARRLWLPVIDVEAGAGDRPVLQRRNQGVLVDD